MSQRRINIIIILLVALLFFVMFSDRIVMANGPSTYSVMFRPFNGGINMNETFGEGIYLVWPWNTPYQFNTREQLVDDTLHVMVNNGVTVTLRINYRYFPIKDSLPSIFRKYGPDYVDVFVKPEILFTIRDLLSDMKPEEIYSFKLDSAKAQTLKQSKAELRKGNVALSDILIIDIKLPPHVVEAIENKLREEQLAQQYEFKIAIANKEKEIKIIDASAIKITQDTISRGLTKEYLQYLQIGALHDLAKSPNSKTIILPQGANNPILVNGQ